MHIGEKIKEVVEQKGISKSELGRRLNMSATNVHKIFKRETIDTGLLQNLASILEFDFFVYYLSSSKTAEGLAVYRRPEIPSNQIKELQKEIEVLLKENKYLKEINDLLREKLNKNEEGNG